MYEFWYDYVKPKYGEKAKLCHMDTDSFIGYIKTDDIYKEIADAETRFDTSDYELDISLPKRKNKKVIGLMKDELGGKIMVEILIIGGSRSGKPNSLYNLINHQPHIDKIYLYT